MHTIRNTASGNRDAYRSKIDSLRDRLLVNAVEWTKPYYARFFKRHRQPWKHNLASLKKLPRHSLGNDLAFFLEEEGIDLMPKLEEHDVMHVLMSYETTVKGEARMQFFLLGNGKRSFYALLTAFVSLFLIPESWGAFFREFSKGRRCRNISHWQFEHLLAEPTKMLRRLIYRKDVGVEAPYLF